jgi:hypothetical protein
MKVIFRSTRPAWSKRQYSFMLVLLWLYTLVWLTVLVTVNLFLPFSALTKVLLTLVLAVLTPTDGHFTSFEKYRQWHAEHVVVTPGR